MKELSNITLLCLDGVDVERAIDSLKKNLNHFKFAKAILVNREKSGFEDGVDLIKIDRFNMKKYEKKAV